MLLFGCKKLVSCLLICVIHKAKLRFVLTIYLHRDYLIYPSNWLQSLLFCKMYILKSNTLWLVGADMRNFRLEAILSNKQFKLLVCWVDLTTIILCLLPVLLNFYYIHTRHYLETLTWHFDIKAIFLLLLICCCCFCC